MIKKIAKRMLWNGITLWIIVSLSYLIIKLAPGNPYDKERALSEEALKALKEKFDFSYWEYLGGILQGNFRHSYLYQDKKVIDLVLEALPVSLELGFWSILLATIIGLLLGGVSAMLRKSPWDPILMLIALVGIAVPNFVLGPLLQLFLGIELNLFSVAGWFHWGDRVLPVFTLAAMYIAYIARIARTSMADTFQQDFIAMAEAKGLSPWQILTKHVLRNSLIPVLHFLAPATAAILTGTMVIEKIFYIPGLGRHFVNSALHRDYPVALAVIILYSTLLLLLNFLADLISTWIDPRIDLE